MSSRLVASLSACELGRTLAQKLTGRKWTWRMVALTSDFDVFAARVAARLTAVFLPVCHIAETWDMRTLFRSWIRHE